MRTSLKTIDWYVFLGCKNLTNIIVPGSSVATVVPTQAQTFAGDVNADGRTNAKDALKMLQYAVGKFDPLYEENNPIVLCKNLDTRYFPW